MIARITTHFSRQSLSCLRGLPPSTAEEQGGQWGGGSAASLAVQFYLPTDPLSCPALMSFSSCLVPNGLRDMLRKSFHRFPSLLDPLSRQREAPHPAAL